MNPELFTPCTCFLFESADLRPKNRIEHGDLRVDVAHPEFPEERYLALLRLKQPPPWLAGQERQADIAIMDDAARNRFRAHGCRLVFYYGPTKLGHIQFNDAPSGGAKD